MPKVDPRSPTPPEGRSSPDFMLTEAEVEVAWAALISIVNNSPIARDAMQPAQWKIAKELLDRMTAYLAPPDKMQPPKRRRR